MYVRANPRTHPRTHTHAPTHLNATHTRQHTHTHKPLQNTVFIFFNLINASDEELRHTIIIRTVYVGVVSRVVSRGYVVPRGAKASLNVRSVRPHLLSLPPLLFLVPSLYTIFPVFAFRIFFTSRMFTFSTFYCRNDVSVFHQFIYPFL